MRDFCVTPSRTHVFLWLFDCSERQRKQLLFNGLPCLGGHGVLGGRVFESLRPDHIIQ